MQTSRLQWTLRRYWANDRINYSIRVFIALVGVALPCWYLNAKPEITPLVLGIIAAALAETDDNLSGRIKALITTLICFVVAAFSIELLFPYPPLFAIGLFCSTFGFIMLGAMGPRYASIAFASLLLAVYTMLGAEQSTNCGISRCCCSPVHLVWHSVADLAHFVAKPTGATKPRGGVFGICPLLGQ